MIVPFLLSPVIAPALSTSIAPAAAAPLMMMNVSLLTALKAPETFTSLLLSATVYPGTPLTRI